MKRMRASRRIYLACVLTLSLALSAAPSACAQGRWPSLFRGVAVAESADGIGVRVVGVDESSQAYQADLRPLDIIVKVREADIRSLDDFAAVSESLRGTTDHAAVVIFRNGAPKELQIHLYSYPVLKAWGVSFIPDYDLRFAQPQIAQEYWTRMGRGCMEAKQPLDALDAYLNALHNVPQDSAVALCAAELFFQLGQEKVKDSALTPALTYLSSALAITERLFASDSAVDSEALRRIRDQLAATVEAIRQLRKSSPPPVPSAS